MFFETTQLVFSLNVTEPLLCAHSSIMSLLIFTTQSFSIAACPSPVLPLHKRSPFFFTHLQLNCPCLLVWFEVCTLPLCSANYPPFFNALSMEKYNDIPRFQPQLIPSNITQVWEQSLISYRGPAVELHLPSGKPHGYT